MHATITSTLVDLGHQLDAHGFDGAELAVRRVVRAAWAAGVAQVAADVLADATAPDVARLRAFAVVSAALSRTDRAPRDLRPVQPPSAA